MDKEFEIPFGAKDSELKGWEYTIPEDMEAVIKDGKIIVREKESEDEKMIRIIEDAICTNEAQELVKAKYGLELTNLADWLEKQSKQKPAWSEEDEANLQFAIDDFQFCVDTNQFPVVYNTEKHKEVLASLKSLKDRVQPHPAWKPTDEQMENLGRAVNGVTYRTSLLMELYKDLKKL